MHKYFATISLLLALTMLGCAVQPTATPLPTRASPSELSFTVKEYRLYHALMGMDMSISEEQALQNVGKLYDASPDEVRIASNKVQAVLLRNGWFGSPESELRHASDWESQQP